MEETKEKAHFLRKKKILGDGVRYYQLDKTTGYKGFASIATDKQNNNTEINGKKLRAPVIAKNDRGSKNIRGN